MKSSVRIPFLNAYFDNIDFDQVVSVVDEHILSKVPGLMVSLNTDIIVHLDKDDAFRRAFESANLVLIDSAPLLKLATLKGVVVREKLSGSDLMPRVCEHAARRGLSCFILGGADGVTQRACAALTDNYPGLKISGYSPEYGFENCEMQVKKVLDTVRSARPDILFICLGTPKSEKFFAPRINDFCVPFTFSVGAAVDFAAGTVKRDPRWMQESGLEWFYRFTQEPTRLFKRYFIDSWKILGIIAREKRISR